MTRLNRRDLLRLGLCAGAFATARPSAVLGAAGAGSQKKLLVVFLRGGNDALNTIIPQGDAQYSPALRPSLYIDETEGLDLDNGFAQLHPSLAKMKELHDIGQLAAIQRVGYAGQSHSHFSSQQFWETAVPNDLQVADGFVARLAEAAFPNDPLAAISVSKQKQRMFRGQSALPQVPGVEIGTLAADPVLAKLLGSAPGEGEPGAGLLGIYGADAEGDTDSLVRANGLLSADTISLVSELPPYEPPPEYYPTDTSTLSSQGLPTEAWAAEFFGQLKTAVQLLRQTDCRIGGVHFNGFDDHHSQGKLVGNHPDHLHVLAHALRSISYDTWSSLWPDLLILVVSEFGRTSRENGSLGTDHGEASAILAAGGGVVGGVYNCDAATWPSGATLFSANDKYVAHATDYRAIYAEILGQHLGASLAELNAAIPGWSGFSGTEFQPLGFVA